MARKRKAGGGGGEVATEAGDPVSQTIPAPPSDTALIEGAVELPQELPLADDVAGPGLEKAAPVSVSQAHLVSVLESLIFVAEKPVTPVQLARLVRSKTAEVKKLLEELAHHYQGRGIELIEVA